MLRIIGMSQVDIAYIRKVFSLLDITSLNTSDTPEIIAQLCQNSTGILGHAAAVCIYPQFVSQANKLLKNTPVKIATVANFPTGDESLADVLLEIQQAINAGAQEIDVVMPYKNYLAGKVAQVKNFIATCKNTCGKDILLKVILETGALQQSNIIANASRDVIDAGADFIKTSTGKITVGATLDAARIILETIKSLNLTYAVGFKAAGGIRTLLDAKNYIELAEEIMGASWVLPNHFRIGASNLHLVLESSL